MTMTRDGLATIDLVRFLLARIDDEEQSLRKLRRRAQRDGHTDCLPSFSRARSEMIAKRQVLGQLQHLLILRDLPSEQPVRDLAAQVLQSMARPYASHTGYRSMWWSATQGQHNASDEVLSSPKISRPESRSADVHR